MFWWLRIGNDMKLFSFYLPYFSRFSPLFFLLCNLLMPSTSLARRNFNFWGLVKHILVFIRNQKEINLSVIKLLNREREKRKMLVSEGWKKEEKILGRWLSPKSKYQLQYLQQMYHNNRQLTHHYTGELSSKILL